MADESELCKERFSGALARVGSYQGVAKSPRRSPKPSDTPVRVHSAGHYPEWKSCGSVQLQIPIATLARRTTTEREVVTGIMLDEGDDG